MKKFVSVDKQYSAIGNERWKVTRLFDLTKDFKAFDIPLQHLYVDYSYENVSLREMAGHMEAVRCADVGYPIILDEDGIIMDGRHRVMRAILDDADSIKAVRFKENPEPCYLSDE